MSRGLHFSAAAETDLLLIEIGLRKTGIGAAMRWRGAMDATVERLQEDPGIFPIADEFELLDPPIRHALFAAPSGPNYRILFEATEERVHVLRLLGPGHPGPRPRDLPQRL